MGTTYPGLHEPLVDSATIEAARRIFGERGSHKPLGARPPSTCSRGLSDAVGAAAPMS